MDARKDYYAILGVLPSIDDAALAAVYRTLLEKYRPDVFPGSKAEAESRTKELIEAYDVLGNSEKRKRYDNSAKANSFESVIVGKTAKRFTQGLPRLKSPIALTALSITAAIFVVIGCLAVRAGLSPPAPAIALTHQQIDQCENKGSVYSLEAMLSACTATIESGGSRGKAAYNNRGNAYYAEKDYDHAIADYTEAIRLDPKYALAHINRGNAYKVKGDYDRAIEDYSEAIRLDPEDALAYFKRGNAYEAKKDYGRAIVDFTEAIQLNPSNANTFNSRCWNRALADRDLQGALADCNESLRLQPNDANTLNSRGLVQLKLGAYERAIADYSAAIAQNAKDAGSFYCRGVAKLKSGDTDGGNADIAASKAIRPDIANVYARYGVT
jgi:tetratricopeptide (TPR) repeat protein